MDTCTKAELARLGGLDFSASTLASVLVEDLAGLWIDPSTAPSTSSVGPSGRRAGVSGGLPGVVDDPLIIRGCSPGGEVVQHSQGELTGGAPIEQDRDIYLGFSSVVSPPGRRDEAVVLGDAGTVLHGDLDWIVGLDFLDPSAGSGQALRTRDTTSPCCRPPMAWKRAGSRPVFI